MDYRVKFYVGWNPNAVRDIILWAKTESDIINRVREIVKAKIIGDTVITILNIQPFK